MTNRTVAIVGASHAGVQLAASLREGGWDGRIVLLGDERHAPYQRPPLSKGLLLGKTAPDQLPLRGPSFWRDQAIELELGCRVQRVQPAEHRLQLADGRTIAWDQLVLATGAACRTLPGPPIEGVLTLRTLDDAQALDAAAGAGSGRAVVIGGGYIGLEAAAALRQRGLEVTVVESQPRLLTRSLPERLAAPLCEVHRAQGIEFLFGAGVQGLQADAAGRVAAVLLGDGRRLEARLVVVGIGVQPAQALAAAAGIAVADGILVDPAGRTSVPDVWAIGDVAAAPNPFAADPARPLRLESIQCALDGARQTAAALLDKPPAPPPAPWFWSEQWSWKLQMTGLGDAADTLVLRGRTDDARCSVFALRRGRIAAVQSVNRPAEHMLARRLVAARCAAAPEQLADESFDLKTLLT